MSWPGPWRTGWASACRKPCRGSSTPPRVEVERSPALSLTFRPGDGSIRGRKVAVLLAPGVDAGSVTGTQAALAKEGAVVRLLAARLGAVVAKPADVEAGGTFETMPSVLFDGVVVPNGAEKLVSLGQALEFLKDQYRHCKPILLLGDAQKVGETAGILADPSDWAITPDVKRFVGALGRHRNWDRATDPPRV